MALTKYSDLIIVLKEGKILEMGTYKELVSSDGEFSKMWNSQANLYN
jgi:ABC-type multidrug transport system fused ATPase/permease subunit